MRHEKGILDQMENPFKDVKFVEGDPNSMVNLYDEEIDMTFED